jgi:hypothetical protein
VIRSGFNRERHGGNPRLGKQLGNFVIDRIDGHAVWKFDANAQGGKFAQDLFRAVLVVEEVIVLEQQDGHPKLLLHAADIRYDALDRHRAHVASVQ